MGAGGVRHRRAGRPGPAPRRARPGGDRWLCWTGLAFLASTLRLHYQSPLATTSLELPNTDLPSTSGGRKAASGSSDAQINSGSPGHRRPEFNGGGNVRAAPAAAPSTRSSTCSSTATPNGPATSPTAATGPSSGSSSAGSPSCHCCSWRRRSGARASPTTATSPRPTRRASMRTLPRRRAPGPAPPRAAAGPAGTPARPTG